jgi:hypothetical protein
VCQDATAKEIAKRVFVASGHRVGLEVVEGMGRGLVAKQDFSPGEVLLDDGDALLFSRYDIEGVLNLTDPCVKYLHDSGRVRVPWTKAPGEDEDAKVSLEEEVHPALSLDRHMQSILQHAWNRGQLVAPPGSDKDRRPCMMMGVTNTTFSPSHFLRMQTQVRSRLDCLQDPVRVMLEVATQPDAQVHSLLEWEPIRDVVATYAKTASILASNCLDVGCGDAEHHMEVLSIPVAMANHSHQAQNALYWICADDAVATNPYDARVRVILHACMPIVKGQQIFITYQTCTPSTREAYVAYMASMGIPDDSAEIGTRPKPEISDFHYPCPPLCTSLNDFTDAARKTAEAQRVEWDGLETKAASE